MNIVIPKEDSAVELRVPVMPSAVEKLSKKGADVFVEAGLGATLGITDDEYKKAGASVEKTRKSLFARGDVVLRLRKPDAKDLALLKKDSIHISFLDPFNEKKLIADMAKKYVSAISMEMIPRSTRAQKMDGSAQLLSSTDI